MNDATVELRCLNCGANMVTGQRFCGDCGQRVISGRLRMHDIGHDLLHAITHADHSIFRLVRELALHPGRVAREYIEGRRKKYFGPFAFLIIAVGVTSFLVLLRGKCLVDGLQVAGGGPIDPGGHVLHRLRRRLDT